MASVNKDKLQGTPFVLKTYQLVTDPINSHIVEWTPSGNSFVVKLPVEYSAEILPKYFKHNNFCSFIRQLNTYGFSKLESKHWEFQHEYFKRDQPELLKLITRRKSKKRDSEKGDVDADAEEKDSMYRMDNHTDLTTLIGPRVTNNAPFSITPQQDWSSILLNGQMPNIDYNHNSDSEHEDVTFRSQHGDHKKRSVFDETFQQSEPHLGFASVILSPSSTDDSVTTPTSSLSQPGSYGTPQAFHPENDIHNLTIEVKRLVEKESKTQETIVRILQELMESRREQQQLEKKVNQLSQEMVRYSMTRPAARGTFAPTPLMDGAFPFSMNGMVGSPSAFEISDYKLRDNYGLHGGFEDSLSGL